MRKEVPNQLAVLRAALREINEEFRTLVRDGGEGRLARMGELKTQRLALMTHIVKLEQWDRVAS